MKRNSEDDINNHSDTKTPKQNKDDKIKSSKVDFDAILPFAGEFGVYQFLTFLSTMPFYVFGVFVYFSQIFITEVSPNHWCWIPELENLTAIERRNLAIPADETSRFGYSQCTSFVANWSEILSNGGKPNQNFDISPCKHGWEFNQSEIPYATISSELGWVCEKASYQATAQSVFFIGSIIGLVFIGWVADRFGRISAITVCNMIGCLGGVATIFATNLTEFSICRFFLGMSYDNCMILVFLLVLEYVGPKYRTFISSFSFAIFYSLAAVALPWIALACGHWKTICLATSLPMVLSLLTPFVLQESPRWLLTRDRVDEVVKNLLTIGRINKQTVPPKVIDEFKKSVTKIEENQNGNMFEVFRRPVMRKLFLLNCLAHICCDIAFDISIRSLSVLKLELFISFTFVSAMELPASLIAAFFLDFIGRRWMMFFMNLLTAVFNLLMAFVSDATLSLVFAVLVRLCISVSYLGTYQWGAEMLPTPVRASGVSFLHMTAFVGTMFAQYFVYLGFFMEWLPMAIAASVCLIGALIALILPETTMKEMPQTFEDAEDLNNNQVFTEVPWLPKRSKYVLDGKDNFAFEK